MRIEICGSRLPPQDRNSKRPLSDPKELPPALPSSTLSKPVAKRCS